MATRRLNFDIPPQGEAATYDEKINDALEKLDLASVTSLVAHGAVGDGITNDYAAIQAVLDAALPGDTILFDPGYRFMCGTKLRIPTIDNLTILGYGATLVSSGAAAMTMMESYDIAGYTNLGAIVTVNVSSGDTTVTLSSAAGISIGDMLQFISTDSFAADPTYTKGELHRVQAIAGNVITLEDAFFWDPTAASLTVRKLVTTTGFRLLGLRYEPQHTGDTALILTDLIDAQIADVHIRPATNCLNCMVIGRGQHVLIERCVTTDADMASSTGYGIAVAGNHITIRDCYGKTCRHFITGGDRSYLSRQVTYEGNYGTRCNSHVLDMHSNIIDAVIRNNRVSGPVNGIGLRVPARALIEGNVLHGVVKGIVLSCDQRDNQEDITIRDNTFSRCSTSGIQADGTTYLIDPIIDGNRFFDFGSAAGSAIVLQHAGGKGARIVNNVFKNLPNVAMSLIDQVDILIANNYLRDYGTVAASKYGILLNACTSARVHGNKFSGAAGKTGVYVFGACNSIFVHDNEFLGFTLAGDEIAVAVAAVNVHGHNNKGIVDAPANIAPTGSPYAYRNTDNKAETIVISGGTVSAIALSRDGATYYTTGLTAGAFRVEYRDYIRVTYTVAPTMTKIPAL